MIDYFAQGFIFFDNALFLFPLLTMGFIWFERRTFYHAICLVLLTILVNTALKITFKVPLSPSIHHVGFAFPSGHMQLATTLYLWFAMRVHNIWFSALIFLLLCGIAWGTIHFGYHNFFEISGGVFFALVTLFFYYFVEIKAPKILAAIVITLATLLLIYIQFYLPMPNAWKGFYGLWGFIIAEKIVKPKSFLTNKRVKLLATIFFLLGAIVLNAAFSWTGAVLAAWIYQLKWLFIGFLLPFVNSLGAKSLKGFKLRTLR
ncbi:MAG: hypothetical protein H0U57_01060 [Tatlockia sp.]|nr:hypothetical protein [Tatlockia sp.]